MFTELKVTITGLDLTDNDAITSKFNTVLNEHSQGPVFIIGSWQTGDFCHIYAAAVHHFTIDSNTPFAMLLVVADGFGAESLRADIRFAMESLFGHSGNFTLFVTDTISKSRAIAAIGKAMETGDNAREPYDATFWAETAIKSMTQGQPLTPLWGELVRGKSHTHADAYGEICQSFMEEYVEKFGISTGRERFVCLWGRTSGMPKLGRELGGANPQYDSSETGNQQLCLWLKYKIPSIKAVFLVGDGFNDATRQLPHVLDLGAFWKRQKGVIGRFQENGFFDYMTAFYDCDVVHLGMKSGGMDTLGVWGQKVVFMDSMRSPAITKGRVSAWSTASLLPVDLSQMPTPLGKAIEIARDQNPKVFKTTFGKKRDVQTMTKIVEERKLDDLFENADLERISSAVSQMFS